MSSAYGYRRFVIAIASGTRFWSLMLFRSRCCAAGRSAPAPLRAGLPGSRSFRSWLLLSQQQDIGEQCAGAATTAEGDLGAFNLHGRATAPQLLHAADHPLEELHRRPAVTERHEAAVGGDGVPAA